MNVAGRLALLFVIVPILELVLLIRIGQVMGLWPTVAMVLLAGVGGAVLTRLEGMRVLVQFQRELAEGLVPGQAILDGICVLIGGGLLLTPGVLTDVMGLALLFPPTRRLALRWARGRLEKGIADGSFRVMTVGLGGPGGIRTWRAGDTGASSSAPELDPTKGIVIEPKDR